MICGSARPAKPRSKYDVIIFGATPAGFAAALAAKDTGADKVLLLEPTAHVGGMASPGGIGLRDCDHDEIRINNSTQYQWGIRNAKHYKVEKPVWQPDNWLGEETFLAMLEEHEVELRLNTTFVEGSAGVRTAIDGTGLRRITAIQLESGEWLECQYVIDASYEGEVMTSSGHVTYTFGRESRQQYNESFGGISAGSIGQFKIKIDPYQNITGADGDVKPETLLRWIQNKPDPRDHIGEADNNLMAYSFRPCVTDDERNKAPFLRPSGYNPHDFELHRRYIKHELNEGHDPVLPYSHLGYHGYPEYKASKFDACCGNSPVGIDAVGLAVGYAEASRAKRKEIYDLHKYYVQGLMWFWANDPSIPEYIREQVNSYGLCNDEWPENDHFPPQLYVREAARMVGDRVYTQNDRIPANVSGGCLDESIAVGSWAYDIHDMERVAVLDEETGEPMAYNEGLTSYKNGGIYFFEIPYYILLPRRQELVNLAVPNCPSVSHVAFSTIREEPTLWQLGQAAGTAAAIALKRGGDLPLQDVELRDLQSALLSQDAFVHWPPRTDCSAEPDLSKIHMPVDNHNSHIHDTDTLAPPDHGVTEPPKSASSNERDAQQNHEHSESLDDDVTAAQPKEFSESFEQSESPHNTDIVEESPDLTGAVPDHDKQAVLNIELANLLDSLLPAIADDHAGISDQDPHKLKLLYDSLQADYAAHCPPPHHNCKHKTEGHITGGDDGDDDLSDLMDVHQHHVSELTHCY